MGCSSGCIDAAESSTKGPFYSDADTSAMDWLPLHTNFSVGITEERKHCSVCDFCRHDCCCKDEDLVLSFRSLQHSEELLALQHTPT